LEEQSLDPSTENLPGSQAVLVEGKMKTIITITRSIRVNGVVVSSETSSTLKS
jgi:hypothetical protein